MKLSDPGATAIIGAASALAGVLLSSLVTLWVESRRRKWEGRRRWDDPRRRAYVNFLVAARGAHTVVDALLESLSALDEAGQAMKAIEEKREGRPDLAKLEGELEALTARANSVDSRIDDWARQLEEASAEIYLIASRPVRDAADAQAEVLHRLLRSSRPESRSWTTAQLRTKREELRTSWWKASEDLQHAVAKELRLESRRRWWQFRKR